MGAILQSTEAGSSSVPPGGVSPGGRGRPGARISPGPEAVLATLPSPSAPVHRIWKCPQRCFPLTRSSFGAAGRLQTKVSIHMGPKLSLLSASRKPTFSLSPPPSPLLLRCALSTCCVPCCSSSCCKVDGDTCPTVPWGDGLVGGVGGDQGPPEVTWAQRPCREGKCTGPDSRTQEAGQWPCDVTGLLHLSRCPPGSPML